LSGCKVEPGLASAAPVPGSSSSGSAIFRLIPDTRPDALVFNRTVSLRDAWVKIQQKSNR